MNLKKYEYFLIITILFGIHLSPRNYPYIRASYLFIAIYIVILFINQKIPFTKKSLSIFFAIFLFGSVPYIFIDNISISRGINYFYYIFQGFIIVFIIVKNNNIDWVKSIIFVYWSLNVIIGFYEVFTGNHLIHANINNYTQSIKNVPLGLFFNQNDYGIFLSIISPYYFMKYFYSKKYKIYYLLALSINIILVISTGSIGAYLTLSINLIIASFLIENKKKSRILYAMMLILAAIIVIDKLGFMNTIEVDYIVRKVTRHSAGMSIIPNDRVEIILSYLKIFKDHVFGVGAGQSIIIGATNYDIYINPHSLFIELGVEYGIVGLVIIISLYFIFLIKIINEVLINRSYIDSYVIISTVFINYVTLLIWSNVPSRILSGFEIFWIFVGIIIIIIKDPKNLRGGII